LCPDLLLSISSSHSDVSFFFFIFSFLSARTYVPKLNACIPVSLPVIFMIMMIVTGKTNGEVAVNGELEPEDKEKKTAVVDAPAPAAPAPAVEVPAN
jgi:hypothetical protein